MDPFGGAREVGVDLEAIEIADDEERRVFERLAVLQHLLVGGVEVLVLPFVFPAEVLLHPDVGPALTTFGFADAALEAVPGAVGVGGGRFGLAEELAEVEKVLLAGGPLGELGGLPLGDEFLRCHGGEWPEGVGDVRWKSIPAPAVAMNEPAGAAGNQASSFSRNILTK